MVELWGPPQCPDSREKESKKGVLDLNSIGREKHVIENFFAGIKHFHRVATLYGLLASSYLGPCLQLPWLC